MPGELSERVRKTCNRLRTLPRAREYTAPKSLILSRLAGWFDVQNVHLASRFSGQCSTRTCGLLLVGNIYLPAPAVWHQSRMCVLVLNVKCPAYACNTATGLPCSAGSAERLITKIMKMKPTQSCRFGQPPPSRPHALLMTSKIVAFGFAGGEEGVTRIGLTCSTMFFSQTKADDYTVRPSPHSPTFPKKTTCFTTRIFRAAC